MGNRLGRNVYVAMGREDSYGAGQAAPFLFKIPRSVLRLGAYRNMEASPEVNPDPNPAAAWQGPWEHDNGELGHVISADSFGFLALMMFGNGDVPAGGGAPYTYTIKCLANAMRSVIVELYDSVEAKSDLFKGVVVHGLRLSYRKRGTPVMVATWRLSGIGAAPTRGGAIFDAPTAFTDARHACQDCTITVDGAATLAPYIESVDLDLNFATHPQDGLTGYEYMDGLDLGAMTFEGTLTARRPTADGIYALCDDAEHIFVLNSPRAGAATRYVKVTMSEVKLEKCEATDHSDKGPVVETFRMFPAYTDHADGTSIVFEIANDRANYTAP